ncbi:MAG: hypothetical protein FJ290_11550 [Planctomycetes bacterium]|nr:hypothetical protein [Planctomycetota bacterium]
MIRLDLLAFSDPVRQNWQTTALAADLGMGPDIGEASSREMARRLFRASAAPTNIVGSATQGKADIWFSCHDGIRPEIGVDLRTETLVRVFERNRADVQKDRVAGLRAAQRHLFDRYVFAQRQELTAFLQHGISKAAWMVPETTWAQDSGEIRSSFSQVALALLAARILEDKGALGPGGPESVARLLLEKAEEHWHMFFTPVLEKVLPGLEQSLGCKVVEGMLAQVLAHLGGPVHFGLVTHEMLGDFWEATAAAERRAGRQRSVDLKGVHYTPFGIAKQILDRIPLENIPPAERTTCDFACGSGSFLLAATERLRDLFDPREPGISGDRLHYLSRHVVGNDMDRPALLVARLSYVLAYWSQLSPALRDMPIPKVLLEGDALHPGMCARLGMAPSVIVGNPPFGGKNPPGRFLAKALQLLTSHPSRSPRYVGMVMPAAFLVEGKTHGEALDALRREARILEVWELPERAVGMYAEHPTCVVIAEVTGAATGRSSIVRVCQTRSRRAEAIRAFKDQGVPDWSYAVQVGALSAGSATRQDARLAFSPLQPIWDELTVADRELRRICESAWGFVHTRSRGKPAPVFSSRRGRGLVPFLRHQTALMPYWVTKEDWKASHKEGEGTYWEKGSGPVPCEANWDRYRSSKIIVTSQTHRNERNQVIAAFERGIYWPGKHFQAIVLQDQWREAIRTRWGDPSFARTPSATILHWLCAILNSPVGHAWVAAHAGPRGPRKDVFKSLPLPARFDPEIPRIVERLRNMIRPRNLRKNPTWDPQGGMVDVDGSLFDHADSALDKAGNSYWSEVRKINELVLGSYGLTEEQGKEIQVYLQTMTDPRAQHCLDVAGLSPDTKLRVLRGGTGRVDLPRQLINLQLSWRSLGRGDFVEVPIPKFMPGWALEEGRKFSCRAPERCTLDQVRADPWLLRDFRPVPYSYLDRQTLEAMIGYSAGGGGSDPA